MAQYFLPPNGSFSLCLEFHFAVINTCLESNSVRSSTCHRDENHAIETYSIVWRLGLTYHVGLHVGLGPIWRFSFFSALALKVVKRFGAFMRVHQHSDRLVVKGAITSKIKHAIKLKASPARLAQLLQPSLAFCFSLQPMTPYRPGLDGSPSLAAS